VVPLPPPVYFFFFGRLLSQASFTPPPRLPRSPRALSLVLAATDLGRRPLAAIFFLGRLARVSPTNIPYASALAARRHASAAFDPLGRRPWVASSLRAIFFSFIGAACQWVYEILPRSAPFLVHHQLCWPSIFLLFFFRVLSVRAYFMRRCGFFLWSVRRGHIRSLLFYPPLAPRHPFIKGHPTTPPLEAFPLRLPVGTSPFPLVGPRRG